jgi:hypothetical protein
MKKTLPLLIGSLLCSFIPVTMGQTGYPIFPSYDPFVNATGSGGSSYAAGDTLAGQTNAMGQYWYAIGTTTSNINAIEVTANTLSYQGLPGFSGNEILLTNASGGMGARMFTSTNTAGTGFVEGAGTNFYYSAVIQVSNINSLSTGSTTNYVMGVGDQSTIANQTSQPSTVGAALYMQKVVNGTTTNFVLGIGKQVNQATTWSTTLLSTNQTYFVVVDYEIVLNSLNGSSGGKAGDNVRLWINPPTNTFGASTQPTADADTSILSTGNGFTLYISCVQMYDHATNSPNNLYLTDFRMGTNWGWATGGPCIGYGPIAGTNCATGVLNLSVTALNNGSANTYNWQFDGANLANGASVSGSGATVSGSQTASLTVTGMDTSATQRDAGAYTVVVSNTWGAVTSAVCAVTAYSAPVITAQPASTNLQLYAGESNIISLSAVGFNPSYYWYSNNTLIASATGPNFITANVEANANIYCVVSNSAGTATSTVVSMTVVPEPTFPYPLTVINDKPIGFWPLSEGPDNTLGNDGTWAHDYISGNNGFYSNVILGLPGYAAALATEYGYNPATDTNSAAEFGTYTYPNTYVAQIPNINFGTNGAAPSFSVEAWVFGYTLGGGAAVVNKGWGVGGEQFTMDYNGGWRFYVRNAIGASFIALSTNTTDGNWHHLVGVLDTVHSNIIMYVDGVARTNTAFNPSGGLLSTTNEVVIGSRMSSATSGAYDDDFNGYIQDVAIYNYALTPSQVANHYYAAGIAPSVTMPYSTNLDAGTTLTVTAGIIGSPTLVLQWYDTTYGYPGTALTGQTNATLVISNVSAAAYDGHTLELTASNIYGQASGQIQVSVLSGPPGSITITPSSLAVYEGVALPFVVTAQGSAPFSYQWTTNGGNVPGATNAVFTNSTLPPGAYDIVCAVANNADTNPSPTASLTVVAVPVDTYGSTVVNAGPVAFWRLDEPANASTANDYVGGHDATYQNAVNGLPGFISSETATMFGSNGVAPSIALENNNTGNGIPLIDFSTQGVNAEFSVETWIQAPPQSGGDVICKGYPNNTQFAIDTGGTGGAFRFVVHTSADAIVTATSGSVTPDGKWHHLVGVCDEANGAIRFYADGALAGTGSIAAGSGILSLSSTYPVVIASQESSGGASFTGVTNAVLSQVALYAYAMTSNQVSAHYVAGTGLPPLSPFNITSWSNMGGTNITLNWQSAANYTYQVQVALTLGSGTNVWTNLGPTIVATGTNTSYTYSSAVVPNAGYFRVVGY